jgi:hypothetical protein
MRPLEATVVFQPEVGQAIHADVRQPQQAKGQHQRAVPGQSGQAHQGRERIGVPNVVDSSAEAAAAYVADHEKVWQKNHRRHEPPRLVRGGIQQQRRLL